MASITSKVTRNSKYKSVLSQYTKSTKALVEEAGTMVHRTAIESINEGAKSGVVYEKYNPRRTHRASAAGEPPASDTGFLVNNILLKFDSDRTAVSVESRANYSSFLEFGTSKLAERPFLKPALDSNKSKIRILEKSMIKAK